MVNAAAGAHWDLNLVGDLVYFLVECNQWFCTIALAMVSILMNGITRW
jgi:hypothetical protein